MQIKMIRGYKGPGYSVSPGEIVDTSTHKMPDQEARYLVREGHAEYVKSGEQQGEGGDSKGKKPGNGKKSGEQQEGK